VRYAITGEPVLENAQPLSLSTARGDIVLAHNGNVTNAGRLRRELERDGVAFLTDTDTEVVLRMLARHVAQHGVDAPEALRSLEQALC